MRTEYEKRTNFSESQKISWGHLKTFGVEKKKAGKELDCDVTQEDFGRGIFCFILVFLDGQSSGTMGTMIAM